MKALKIIGILIIILAAAIAGIAYYGYQNSGALIKDAVEKYGSEAIGTQVSLNTAKLNFDKDMNSSLKLSGLTVANPSGFSSDHALQLNEISVQLQPKSQTKELVIIDKILMSGAHIIAEEKNLNTTNLTTLADNLSQESSSTSQTSTNSSSSATPNLIVKSFEFNNATVDLISEQLGNQTVKMPNFSVKNLGGSKGLPPEALATALMDEILDQATSAVKKETRNAAKEKVRSELKDKLNEKLSDEDKEKLEGLKSLFKR
ncbi:MAG: AsmA family protein [Cellvibrionaceae bacterium]